MYILYHENKDRFLAYCDEVKKKCDNMAKHRINVLLEEITGKKYLQKGSKSVTQCFSLGVEDVWRAVNVVYELMALTLMDVAI